MNFFFLLPCRNKCLDHRSRMTMGHDIPSTFDKISSYIWSHCLFMLQFLNICLTSNECSFFYVVHVIAFTFFIFYCVLDIFKSIKKHRFSLSGLGKEFFRLKQKKLEIGPRSELLFIDFCSQSRNTRFCDISRSLDLYRLDVFSDIFEESEIHITMD